MIVPAATTSTQSGLYVRPPNKLKLRDRRVQRLTRKMYGVMPWLEPSDLPTARAWARLELMIDTVYAILHTNGPINGEGEPRRLLAERRYLRQAQLRFAEQLGTPPAEAHGNQGERQLELRSILASAMARPIEPVKTPRRRQGATMTADQVLENLEAVDVGVRQAIAGNARTDPGLSVFVRPETLLVLIEIVSQYGSAARSNLAVDARDGRKWRPDPRLNPPRAPPRAASSGSAARTAEPLVKWGKARRCGAVMGKGRRQENRRGEKDVADDLQRCRNPGHAGACSSSAALTSGR